MLNTTAEPRLRIKDNPLMIAQARRRVRKKEITKTLLVPVILGLCAVLYGVTAHDPTGTVWLVIYKLFFFVAGVILFLRGTAQISGLMASERISGILDFHRASPTSGWTDGLGYLVGGVAREYLIFAAIIPFMLFAAASANVDLVNALAALMVVVLSATMYHLYGMLVGLTAGKKRSAAGAAVGQVLLLLFFGEFLYRTGVMVIGYMTPYPALANLGFMGGDEMVGVSSVSFFGYELHPIFYTVLVQSYMSFFLMWAVARKLRRSDLPALSRRGAMAFLSIFTLLLLGGSWDILSHGGGRFDVGGPAALILYLISSVIFAALVIIPLAPSYLHFVRRQRRLQSAKKFAVSVWDKGAPILNTLFAFWGILLAAFLLLVGGVNQSEIADVTIGTPALVYLASSASFLFFFAMVSEFASLAGRKNRKGVFSLTLFLIVALPWVVAGVFRSSGVDIVAYTASISPIYGLIVSSTSLGAFWFTDSVDVIHNSVYFSIVVSVVAGFFFRSKTRAATRSIDVPAPRLKSSATKVTIPPPPPPGEA
jgi:hypothetical protein